ncbi:MAG: hypothetical protein JXR77_02895 [Lentisphaeria bacterium]|nr:hypothetical protein [Lentisphaeria bacterium]
MQPAPDRIGSTEHFHYRLQPEGPSIDSQRGSRAFGFTDDAVHLSEDNGRSWVRSLPFPEARDITFSCILGNGNILFGAGAGLYLSADALRSCTPVPVLGPDGSVRAPHVPADPGLPGWYFHTLSGINSWEVNGVEMVVWGNYCNVLGGAAPVRIYYSTDGGHTVRIAYEFGQNPHFRDNGSPGGGNAGTLLGDPANPVICRHLHTVAYNPDEDAFYACTGDGDRPEGLECHWLRGTYDATADRWDWRVLLSDHLNSRYKAGGISFVNGQLYWISDSNGPEPYDRGIFRCAPEDILDKERHTLLFNPGVESGNMIIEDGVILASHCAPASPMATGFIVSLDGGVNWAQYDLAEFGRRSPCRFHPRNAEGWFRVDLRKGWVEPGEVLFIKPRLP